MSLFKKMFAGVGLGGAKIDTKLHYDEIPVGGEASGEIEIKGGSVSQEIEAIKLHLVTELRESREAFVLESFVVAEHFELQENTFESIPFSFYLPYDTPISTGHVQVWLRTELDIRNAVDSRDEDFIQVIPDPIGDAFFAAMEKLGFHCTGSELIEVHPTYLDRLPFVQEFEFKPTAAPYRGRLDEVEAIIYAGEQESEFLLEIDRKARGLGGWMREAASKDEEKARIVLTHQEAQSITRLSQQLSGLFDRFS